MYIHYILSNVQYECSVHYIFPSVSGIRVSITNWHPNNTAWLLHRIVVSGIGITVTGDGRYCPKTHLLFVGFS